MNKKAQLGVGGILMLFIGIVVCLVIIQQIFNSQTVMTTKTVVTDESFNLTALSCITEYQVNTSSPNCNLTVTNAPSGWKVDKCGIGNVVVSNGSGTAWTLTTDYTVTASSGKINLKNTATTNGSDDRIVLVDYNWCPDGYNPDGSSRGIAALIGLLSVLGLFVWVISTGRFDEWFG